MCSVTLTTRGSRTDVIGRIVEISGESRYLSVDRGFMVVKHRDEEVGRVALDDISGLICTAHGATYSNNLIMALSRRGCPIVLCGANFMPAAIIWPTQTHHLQSARLDGQIAMSKPARGRLWKDLVKSKISMQAAALALCGKRNAHIKAMVRKVRAADASNVEGQAARAYWVTIFGREFRRDPDSDGVNGLLNYGYAIIRSAVARHLMAAGLHPGIPLHHSNDGNPMRLVDDVMEPFRPIVDCVVWRMHERGVNDVDANSKRVLAVLLAQNLVLDSGVSPVSLVIQRLCISLAQYCVDGETKLELPHTSKGILGALWDDDKSGEDAIKEEGDD